MVNIQNQAMNKKNSSIGVKEQIIEAFELIRYKDASLVLYVLTNELDNLLHCSKNCTLLRIIQESGTTIPPSPNLFNAPDLIWQTISRRHPEVYIYPLGEINERALKSTIGEIIAAHYRALHDSSNNVTLCRMLEKLFSDINRDEIISIFLTNWFFNLAITNLRSTDLGFAYHFSRQGKYVSIAKHISLRKALFSACRNVVDEIYPFFDLKLISEFDEAFEKVFRLKPTRKVSGRQSKKPYLNVVVGTTTKSQLNTQFNIRNSLTRIVIFGKKRKNVKFGYSVIESKIGLKLSTLVKDLLEIGFAIYIADKTVERQQNLERHLSILIPVRHVERWSSVKIQLEHVISLLGRDQVDIHFIRHEEKPDERSYDLKNSNECCCLLSGGIDSAVGAMWTLQKTLNPILISHTPGNILPEIQKDIVQSIEQEFGQQLNHVLVPWNKSGKRKGRYKIEDSTNTSMLQYLRSFFYLCLATGIAIDKGDTHVYVFENGPVAINPILAESHINTRTVHPIFLREFSSLIKAVFGTEIHIENPFIYKTKGEILKVIENESAAFNILPKTNSCLHYWRVKLDAARLGIENSPSRQDGVCLPCMLRRVAMSTANFSESENYLTDIFDLLGSDMAILFPARVPDILIAMADFLLFCQYITKYTDGEILSIFPDLSVCTEGVESSELLSMMKRHGREVVEVFRKELKFDTKKVFYSSIK